MPSYNEPIIVKPSNNVYTVLAAVALLAVITALVVIFLRAAVLFPAVKGGSGGLL